MRVAVIGGTGFVGRHLVDELQGAGHEVTAVGRSAPAGWHGGFRAGDATRPHALDAAIAGSDAVVWAAGSMRQRPGQSFHDIHVGGPRQLVVACRATRVRRVVMLSSHGASAGSKSAFHRAKYAGEDLLRRSLLDVTVLRPSSIFGRGDDFVVPLGRMLRNLPFAPVPGRGDALLSPVWAPDVARATRLALERDDTLGNAYDLPGPETLTIREIYDRVTEALGLRRRPHLRVPYLFIEPLTYFFGSFPGAPWTFDHLAILEEEPKPAVRAPPFELELTPFVPATLRPLVK